MRSPINQVPINGTSVNVWVEAAVSSSGAAAFGIAVRHVKPTAISSSEAQAHSSVDRTAYPTLPALAVNAGVDVDVLRTANVRLDPQVADAVAAITVTRYAWARLPEPQDNHADVVLADDAVTVYAVVKALPVQGRAITWVPRNGVVRIRTRLQKVHSTRTSTAEVRILPNTIIGRGACLGESDSHVLPGYLPITHSFTGSCTGEAASLGRPYRRTRSAEATVSGSAEAAIGPTIVKDGIRYSYNHAIAVSTALSGLVPHRITQGTLTQAVGECALPLKVSRVQRVTGVEEHTATSQAACDVFHVHRIRERLQASSFSYLGTEQYRLIWGEGVLAPMIQATGVAVNLRWVGMGAVARADAGTGADYWRNALMAGITEIESGTSLHAYVKRRILNLQLLPEATERAISQRGAYVGGTTTAIAVPGSALGNSAVRWVSHGSNRSLAGSSESTAAIPKRIVPFRVSQQVGEGIMDATAVKQRLVRSMDEGKANSINVIAPIRTAIMQYKGEVSAEAEDFPERWAIYHNVHWQGVIQRRAHGTAQGLRITRLAPTPAVEGNAAMFRVNFKINADSRAPFTRQIDVRFVDRSLSVPATDREYRV